MADFDLSRAVPVDVPAAPSQAPAAAPLFDLNRSIPVNLPDEQIYVEQTGETVQAPAGSTNTLSQIWDKSLAKGDNTTSLNKLYFEQWYGNDNPMIKKEIKRLEKLTIGEIKTDNLLEDMLSGSLKQVANLKEMAFAASKRAGQGAVAGGITGWAFAGVGVVPGFFAGLTSGAIAGPVETAFILETGAAFKEIRDFKDTKGKVIDVEVARMGAVLAGAASAGLEALPIGLLLRLVPGAKTIVQKMGLKATDLIKIPGKKKALKNFLVNVSTLIVVETGVEMTQELAQIAGGEAAKNISPEDFKPITNQEILERVAKAGKEALLATPMIGMTMSSPRLAQDLAATRKEKPKEDPKVRKIKAVETEVVDRVTEKIRNSPISDDMKTFDAKLTVEEAKILADAGVQVAPDGSIPVSDAELVAAESMRRTDAYTQMVSQAQTAEERGLAEAGRKVARERIKKLDKEVAALDQRFDETLETINERKAQGKPTKALDNRITAMLAKREAMDKERSDLLTAETPLEVRKQEANATDQTIEVKGVELVKAKAREAKAVARSINKTLTKGVQLAKKDVKAAQDAAIKAIQNSGLSKEDISDFMVAVRNIQSAAQFAKAMPRIQNRINQKLNKRRAQKATSLLKAALKRTRVKNNKGKFGPDIQEVLDAAREAMAETKDSAKEKIQASDSTTEIPSPEAAFRNRILAFRADPNATDVGVIEQLLEDVVTLMTSGKNLKSSGVLRQKADSADKISRLMELMGDERVETDNKRRRREWLAAAETQTFLNLSGAWWNKLERIMRSSNKAAVDALVNELSLFKENRDFARGTARSVERFTELAMATGDYKTQRALFKQLSRDETTAVNMGDFQHSDQKPGQTRNLEIKTRAQLRKRVMELRDPKIKEALMSERGNAYTEEIIQALENEMSEVDMRLVEAELQFYEEYYHRINEVYRRTNGINLPKLEFYSPIKRLFEDGKTDEFLTGVISLYRGGVAPSALKKRAPSSERYIKESGDIEVLHSHINEMEYFIAYAEKLQSLNVVMKNSQVKLKIKRIFGDQILSNINMDLDHFSKKGVNVAEVGQALYVTLMRNFSFAQLGLKPQIGLKQLASFAAYAQDVPIVDFTAGLAAFAKNPRAAIKELNQSELFATRGSDNIDLDYKSLLSDKSWLNVLGRNPDVAKVIMVFIKHGDRAAIAFGGYGHYHAMLKKNGGDKAAALASFDTLTVRTQQSSDIDQISQLQRSSSWGRIMTQFMSSANALTRAEYSAILGGLSGRLSRKEFAKRILILHVVIPNMIQFIANGFNWEWEDQLQASLLGTLNGVFVVGDLLEASVRWGIGGVENVFDLSTRHPMSFFKDLLGAIEDISENGISINDWLEGSKAIDGVLQAGGALTSVPMKTINNELRGLVKTGEGIDRGRGDKLIEGPALMLGYSPYIIDNKILAQ